MKKTIGVALIVIGAILILISIMALVKGFDAFSAMELDTHSVGYAFGSILFPLLLTVFGRWVFRKGFSYLRKT